MRARKILDYDKRLSYTYNINSQSNEELRLLLKQFLQADNEFNFASEASKADKEELN